MNTTLTLPWWEWRPAIDRLFTWGRALLRGRRYRILLNDQDRHLGWEDARSATICLNPLRIASLVPNQDPRSDRAWNLARAILAHEVGHARFSGPCPQQPFRVGPATSLSQQIMPLNGRMCVALMVSTTLLIINPRRRATTS